MFCNVKLENSSLAQAKLREHFTKVHDKRKYKTPHLINLSGSDLVVVFQWINRFSLLI